ncbi:MAG: glycosyltransferase [Bacteroidetes bacterium]|nr:glycosyltransferase [Bacteroidota bacterium]
MYLPGILCFLLLVSGIFLFSFAQHYFLFYSLFGVVVFFYLGISYFVGILGKDFSFSLHQSLVRSWKNEFPSVDVYYPVCGEDVSIIRNALNHIVRLDWPGKLQIYVLDDGFSSEVKQMAHDLGVHYVVRPDRPHLKKAGNLRNAFKQTSGDFILILDADFCPRPDMLREMMPYMLEYKDVAIVQSPQYFEIKKDQSWVEKGAGYVQELFYRMIQVSRDSFDAAICVGTCALYRRSALEPFGGTAAIGYSEDVHTGFQVMQNGWRVRYIPIILAKGVCPSRLDAFFLQQYRWAMGSITLCFNKEFWKTDLTFMQRVCYLTGMSYYIVTGISLFLTPIPAMLLVWLHPEMIFWYNYIFSVPSFIFGIFGLAMWCKAPFGWYGVMARQASFYAHLFALKDKLMGTLVPWQSTGAVRGGGRFLQFKNLFFFWTIFQFVWIFGFVIHNLHDYHFYHFIPVLFFTSFNFLISMLIIKDQE